MRCTDHFSRVLSLTQVVNKADLFQDGAMEAVPQPAPQPVLCEMHQGQGGSEAEPVSAASRSFGSRAQEGEACCKQLPDSSVTGGRLQDSGAAGTPTPGHEPAAQLGLAQREQRARSGRAVVTSAVTGEGLDELLLEVDRRVSKNPVAGLAAAQCA